jgi:hypothetical protein
MNMRTRSRRSIDGEKERWERTKLKERSSKRYFDVGSPESIAKKKAGYLNSECHETC